MLRRTVIGAALAVLSLGSPLRAVTPASASGFRFPSIEGGEIALSDFVGRPVLIVNTASRCAFTGQYDGLQALHDRYRDRGLTVIGVPSDSFRQELASGTAVKAFCEANFAIDFPMTGITPVIGPQAHPFYLWAQAQGVTPRWNFNKILLDGQGRIVGSWGSTTRPDSPKLVAAIEAVLPATTN